MTVDELLKEVSANNMLPIPVEGEIDRDNVRIPVISGTLQDFLRISKALESKGILIYSRMLAVDDFLYEPEEDEPLDEESELEESDLSALPDSTQIDLTAALPELARYRDRLGAISSFFLSSVGSARELGFYLGEGWWEEFSHDRDQAIRKVKEDRQSVLRKMIELRTERDKELKKMIRSFIKDDQFAKLPTQRAMKSYALEHSPELEDLSQSVFTEEVRKLWDTIRSKGLHRKRR